VKQELEMNGEKAMGAVVEDVPDDLCYRWAEDYYNDPDADVDKDENDVFVPKRYSGGYSSSKSKKKEPVKKKEPAKAAASKDAASVKQMQLTFGA
jgi:hypothetical protein